MRTQSSPNSYGPAIEANFHTSGVNIGRTKDTHLVRSHAKNEHTFRVNDDRITPAELPGVLDSDIKAWVAKDAMRYAGVDVTTIVASEAVGAKPKVSSRKALKLAKREAAEAVGAYENLQRNTAWVRENLDIKVKE